MATQIEDLSGAGSVEWDRFVLEHPLATVYHHSAWHRVVEQTYGHKAQYCTVRSDNRLLAGLPFVLADDLFFGRRIVAFPYSDSCDHLVSDDGQLESIQACMLDLAARTRCRSVEIRGFKIPGSHDLFSREEKKYVNFLLRLDQSESSLFQSFHPSCIQRGIRKAERGNMEIVEDNTLDGFRAFYALHLLTRKRHGLPAQPFTFFKNLWKVLNPLGMTSLLLGSFNGTPVCAIVALKFGDILYYKFAASDTRFLNQRPNHLLMWHLLRSGAGEGYRYLDFGRTYTADRGLMEWKKRWGAESYYLHYGFMLTDRAGSVAQEGSAAHELLSRIFRHMPCFAIRMSGALLYRYLA